MVLPIPGQPTQSRKPDVTEHYHRLGGRMDSPDALRAYAAGRLPGRTDRLALGLVVALFCTLGVAFCQQEKQPLPLRTGSVLVALPFGLLAGGATYVTMRRTQLRDMARYTEAAIEVERLS